MLVISPLMLEPSPSLNAVRYVSQEDATALCRDGLSEYSVPHAICLVAPQHTLD
jgi:hypothetical protein